jgi:hypothetical protein
MNEKYLGYFLLLCGLGIMGFGAFSVYSVFTGQASPYMLFEFEAISVPLSALLGSELGASAEGLPDVDLFPADILNSTTNTLAHLLLMGFVVSIGYRLSMIGVNLIRPVVVKMGSNSNLANKKTSVLEPKKQE